MTRGAAVPECMSPFFDPTCDLADRGSSQSALGDGLLLGVGSPVWLGCFQLGAGRAAAAHCFRQGSGLFGLRAFRGCGFRLV